MTGCEVPRETCRTTRHTKQCEPEQPPTFCFKQMGSGMSRRITDAQQFRFSSLPRGLSVEGNEAFLDMPDGSRRLIAVRGGRVPLTAGRDTPPPDVLEVPREPFESMWARMQQDSGDQFRVPLPDEAYEIVEAYYDSHPQAVYDSVRGFGMSMLPRFGDRLPRALRLLMFQTEIGFFDFQTELETFETLVTQADRPEPFIVFPAEFYDRWEGFIDRARIIEEDFQRRGVPLPPLVF